MGVTIWGRSGEGTGTPRSSNGPAVPLYPKLLTWGSCCNTECIYQTLGSKEKTKKNRSDFREILTGLDIGAGEEEEEKGRVPDSWAHCLPIPDSLQSHLGIPSTQQP